MKDDNTKVCVFYENKGPAVTKNAVLLVSLDNAIYGSSDVPAERGMLWFAFGWELGNLEAGDSGYLLASIMPIEDDKPVSAYSLISDAFNEPIDAQTSVDPTGADANSIAYENPVVENCGP